MRRSNLRWFSVCTTSLSTISCVRAVKIPQIWSSSQHAMLSDWPPHLIKCFRAMHSLSLICSFSSCRDDVFHGSPFISVNSFLSQRWFSGHLQTIRHLQTLASLHFQCPRGTKSAFLHSLRFHSPSVKWFILVNFDTCPLCRRDASFCFALPGLVRRRDVCHAQFLTVSGITLHTRSTVIPSNHGLEVRDRFSTIWLARSILSALALDAFGVSLTVFWTALISFSRVLSVGLNASHAPTNLASTLVTDMAENAASDSKRPKTAFTCCGSVAFDKKRWSFPLVSSPSCVPARSVCLIHCLSTLCPGLMMCNLTCIVFVPVHVTWYCLVFESVCFLTLLQRCCIEFCLRVCRCLNSKPFHSELHVQRCSIRAFRCPSWQPIHSAVFSQLCHIWVLRTRSGLFTWAWQHHLVTSIRLEPVTLLWCFAKMIKPTSASSNRTWNLWFPKCVSSTFPCAESSSAVTNCVVALVVSLCAVWSDPFGEMPPPAHVSIIRYVLHVGIADVSLTRPDPVGAVLPASDLIVVSFLTRAHGDFLLACGIVTRNIVT